MANVIKNGDFSLLTGWSLSTRATIQSSGGRQGGCLQYANNSEGGIVDASQKVQLTPGKTYTLNWYAKKNGRYDMWGAHAYFTTAGEYKYFNGPSLESLLSSTVYVPLAYTISLPSNVRDSDVWVYMRAGADSGDGNSFIYVDDVSLDDGTGGGTGPTGPIPTLNKTFFGTCNGNDVKIRTGPDTSYPIKSAFSKNNSQYVSTFTGVGTTDQQRSWLTFEWFPGEYVYVYACYMSMNPSPSSALTIGPRAKVTATDTNLRVLPNTNSSTSIIKNLGNGVKMIVLDATSVSDWWRVGTEHGTGWVFSSNVAYE